MKKKYIRFTSRFAVWSPRFGGVAFLMLLFSMFLQRFALIRFSDLIVLMAISACCVFISLFFAVKALYNLWVYGARGGIEALKGIVYSLITATPLALFIGLWFSSPAIYDVSTDTQNPPVFFRMVRPSDALPIKRVLTEQVALQMSEWPEMSGRRYDGTTDRILKSVLSVLASYGWPVIAQRNIQGEEGGVYIETIAKTFYLGFISDIVIRLTDEGDTTFVDMRSASRYLPRDFGANADFIIAFMDALDTEIASLPLIQDNE